VYERGHALLRNSVVNKQEAFTATEREELGLQGLLPPRVLDIKTQVMRDKKKPVFVLSYIIIVCFLASIF
jgi:malate dehydrogenase (oxaloacetate-decarboxylating)(NADP+)